MNAMLTLLTLTCLRLVIPFGLVLWLGTWAERREETERRAM